MSAVYGLFNRCLVGVLKVTDEKSRLGTDPNLKPDLRIRIRTKMSCIRDTAFKGLVFLKIPSVIPLADLFR
jgi:hypothetical protein